VLRSYGDRIYRRFFADLDTDRTANMLMEQHDTFARQEAALRRLRH